MGGISTLFAGRNTRRKPGKAFHTPCESECADCEDFAESVGPAFAIAGISPPVGVAVPGCSSAAYPVHQHQTDASGGADMLGFN